MIDNKSHTYQPGQAVPEGFSTPAGLAEMIKAGDIGEAPVEKQEDQNDFLNFEQAVEFLSSEGVSLEDFGADENSFEPVTLKDLKKAVAEFKKAKGESTGGVKQKKEKTPEEKAEFAAKMKAARAAKKAGN